MTIFYLSTHVTQIQYVKTLKLTLYSIFLSYWIILIMVYLTFSFAYSAKRVAIACFFVLFDGFSEKDWPQFFCQYFTICYPGSVWPGSELYAWNGVCFPAMSSNTCPTTAPMTTKLGKMEAYLERLLPIKLYDDLITRCCKITW